MDWLIWFAVVVAASLGVIVLVSVGVEWALTRAVRTLSSSDLAVIMELLCRDLDGQPDPADACDTEAAALARDVLAVLPPEDTTPDLAFRRTVPPVAKVTDPQTPAEEKEH